MLQSVRAYRSAKASMYSKSKANVIYPARVAVIRGMPSSTAKAFGAPWQAIRAFVNRTAKIKQGRYPGLLGVDVVPTYDVAGGGIQL